VYDQGTAFSPECQVSAESCAQRTLKGLHVLDNPGYRSLRGWVVLASPDFTGLGFTEESKTNIATAATMKRTLLKTNVCSFIAPPPPTSDGTCNLHGSERDREHLRQSQPGFALNSVARSTRNPPLRTLLMFNRAGRFCSDCHHWRSC